MGGPLIQAADFLLRTLFDLYILAVLLRFLMQLTRADFYNPVSQFLVTVTNPCLKPLRRLIPGLWGIDIAALLLCVILEVVKLGVLYLLLYNIFPNVIALTLLGIVDILSHVLNIYFWAIIVIVIISWVNPGLHNPVTSILYGLTEPLMRPIRQIIPIIAGLDLSPMIVLILIQLINILVLNPLTAYVALLSVNIIR